uniref:non-ribosomal peptide synthetase n=1 Tax=Rhodococcus marinonascens TaxID=38311 RepID=UPI000ADFB8FA
MTSLNPRQSNSHAEDPNVPDGAFPLSSVQRSMWFAQQLSPTVPKFIAQYVELRGEIDLNLLSEAAVTAAREFQSPFLRLLDVDGEPYQMVDYTLDTSIPYSDFRGDLDPMTAARAWMDKDYATPLRSTRARMIEMTILQVGEQHYLWHTRMYHVGVDGYSGMTMINRVAALYTAAIEGIEPEPNRALDVRELYELDQKYRASTRFENDRQYWAERIVGIEHGSTLATRDALAAAQSRVESATLSEIALSFLDQSNERFGATSAAVLVAAFACFLSRMTGKRDVLVNLPVSARTTAPLQRSGGMLVNVAPLHITVQSEDTAAELVQRVQLAMMGALRHQRCSLEDIRRDAGLAGSPDGLAGPVVNIMLFHHSLTLGSVAGEYHIVTSGPVDDLLVNLYQGGDGQTLLDFRGNPNRYSSEELRTHHRRFVELAEEFVTAEADTRITDIHAESARLGAEIRERESRLEFWKRDLAGLPEVIALPLDRPRPAERSGTGDVVGFALDADVHHRVAALAEEADTGVFTTLHAALAVLLGRIGDTDDVVIGTPVTAQGAGAFPDKVVLRSRVDGAASFIDHLHQIRDADRAAFTHAALPFDELVATLVAEPDSSHAPLFQVMLEFTAGGHPHDSPRSVTAGPIDSEPAKLKHGAAGLDLVFSLSESESGGIRGQLRFATDVWDRGTVEALTARLVRILQAVTADPVSPIGDVDILEPVEYTELAPVHGEPSVEARSLPGLLLSAVEAGGDGDALVFEDRTLTYPQLDAQSDRLARILISHGVGPGSVVALAIARSIESVLATWAVAKSGAAFVPVDPHYPADRINHMLTDSGALVGLTVAAQRPSLPETTPWLVMDDAAFERSLAEQVTGAVTDEDRLRPLRTADPAYLIYTSGSTGTPKGVVVTHVGLANFAEDQRGRFVVTAESRTLHFSSPSFDASVLELLLAVGAGATMVVAPSTVYGGTELADLLHRERVTHAFVTPAALASVDPSRLDHIRCVVTGGESCPPALVAQWAPGRVMFNAYGPTEATVVASIAGPLTVGEPVTIGRPSRGCSLLVLDARLHPVPIGVPGELYIIGDGVARGYHNRSISTAERFVADPHGAPGVRMYRTGDLARWNQAGDLEYLGRTDFQVKIRGFRIELGEIDAVVRAHPTVAFAITVGQTTPSGDTALVTYVLPESGEQIDVEDILEHAAAALPAHMVPARVMVLPEVPLTPAGKLDRKALPEPHFETTSTVYRAPTNPTEMQVADVFATLLGVDRIGVDDSFFDLGGDSLVATRVVSRVNSALSSDIGVLDLFEAPSVALLSARVDALGPRSSARPELTPRQGSGPVQVSLAQQRMWFINQLDTASPAYNIPVGIRLRGTLDVKALRSAIDDVLTRHESLRTVFPNTPNGPIQVVLPVAEVSPHFTVIDVPANELESRLITDAAAGFDVTAEPPIRAHLYRTATDDHELVFVVHHIAADGLSMTPLTRDVMVAYHARVGGSAPQWAPLEVQYADFAVWQRELLGSPDDPTSVLSRQLSFWARTLDGAPEVMDLPTDRPRPARQSMVGATADFTIPARIHTALLEIAGAHDASLFMVTHAALAVLLSRSSGSSDVSIGSPVSGRGERQLDDVVGMFVNTVVLRTAVDPERSFREILSNIRSVDLAAFSNTDLPYERLVDELKPTRSEAHSPLFQVMLVLQGFANTRLELPGLDVEVEALETGAAKFDLQVILTEHTEDSGAPGPIDVQFSYASELFDPPTMTALAERFVTLLEMITARSDVKVGDLDLIGDAENHRMLEQWIDTDVVVPESTLVELFEAQATRTPDAVAVVFGGEELLYAEFDARANRLARELLARGVGPESRVAVALRRSLELMIAIYAVEKTGAAYVPLDPDHPASRIAYVIESAEPACVLTSTRDRPEGVGVVESPTTIEIDTLNLSRRTSAPITDTERGGPIHPDSVAYVIYTSGSTGRPKGVAVSHRAIVNRLLWMQDTFRMDHTDVVLQKTPVTFDVSVWELFWPLQVGARLVLAAPDGHRDPTYLSHTIADHQVTTMHFVPSMLAVFTAGADPDLCGSLRQVFCSGEALPPATADTFREFGTAALHNLYGPTEAAVDVTYWESTEGDRASVPIGAPVWNTQVYVLDSRLHPVPVGVHGELYLAGVQLARGYVGRSDLTSDRFVANPFGEAGQRMYRTGDVVRWRADGNIEYIGRRDFQVKLRGQRIELGEVEAAVLAHPSVAQAVVTVHRSEVTGESLVGYVIPVSGIDIDTATVRDAAAEALPAYMVPTRIIVLDKFPLGTTGKLDRGALPEPEFLSPSAEFVTPRNPIEEILASIFADLLDASRIGVHDSFFDLGGNSLVATRLVARVNAALGSQIGVREIFDAPTVAALATRVESDTGNRAERPQLVAGERPARLPVSLAQKRMWFINQFDPDSAAYNIALAVRLTGDLDDDAIQDAVADVMGRHESLRTLFPMVDGEPLQRILPTEDVVPDLTPIVTTEAELPEHISRLAGAGFDVTVAVPVRAALFRTDPEEHVLVIVVHHISADGFSMAPLARDVMTAYAARTGGQAPDWTALPVQYPDFALWQHRVLGNADDPDSLLAAQLDYWTRTLTGLPELLALPIDHPRPTEQSMRGDVHAFSIDPEVHSRLVTTARDHNSSVFMAVHAALAVLLARLGDTDDVAVGTPIAGRGDAALDDMVGMFVNTLVLRTSVEPGVSFTELLSTVRDTDLSAFHHADLPFERLVDAISPERATSHSPLFQVVLEFRNNERPRLELPGLTVTGLDLPSGISNFDLQLTLTEEFGVSGEPAGISAAFTYSSSLFEQSTIAEFANYLQRIFDAVTSEPETAVGDIALMAASERAALTPVTGGPDAESRTLPELLAAAATVDPKAAALSYDGREVTYRSLDERSNRLARLLIGRGIGPESVVALAMSRSLESVLSLWAVAKTGAAFVPVDPNYPTDRIVHMLSDSDAALALTVSEFRPNLPDCTPYVVVDAPGFGDEMAAHSAAGITDADRTHPLFLENLAYLIYTSGSTGTPKGVGVTHRGLANFATDMRVRFGVTPRARTLHFASPSFDASIMELILAVGSGATMVIASASIVGGTDLAEVLRDGRVTHAFMTPAAMASVDPTGLDLLRVVATGGDVCPPELVAQWATDGRRMFNAYGPTEATVVSSSGGPLVPGEVVTIGRPPLGTGEMVLDSRLHPVPIGVTGELYVTGSGLARGYKDRAGTTAERFVANPYGGLGARMYRTGDLSRWNNAGQLEYLGRSDFQVKIRGFRIELGEIESVLTRYPGVAQSVVSAHTGSTGANRLVGYLVPVASTELDTEAILEFTGRFLAPYMVPSALIVLDELPLTPAGKLDRRALPEPDFGALVSVSRAPVSEMESVLAGLFTEVLGLESVGVDDSFFSLGGDSIMSIQLVARAKAAGVILTPRDVFESKTVAGLAAVASWAGSADVMVLEELPGGGVGEMPTTPITSWLLERGGEFNRMSQSALLIAPPDLHELEPLIGTFQAVLDRHDMLRAQLNMSGEKSHLEVRPVGSVEAQDLIRVVAVSAEPGTPAFAAAVIAELDAALDRLDPAAGVMMQVVWFDAAESGGRLLVVAHHLVVDGVSWRILVPDLATAWAQISAGHEPALDRVGTSMRRWAHGLADEAVNRTGELDLWQRILDCEDPPVGSRPLNPDIDVNATVGRITVQLPAEVSEAVLTVLPEAVRGSVNDGLLTALALAVTRWRRTRGVMLDTKPVGGTLDGGAVNGTLDGGAVNGTLDGGAVNGTLDGGAVNGTLDGGAVNGTLVSLEGHGREDQVVPGADLGRTVGWFTAMFPVRLDLVGIDLDDAFAGGEAAGAAIKSVKEQLLAIPDHGMGYGMLRYLNGDTAPQLAARSVPQISFNYLGRFAADLSESADRAGWTPTGEVDMDRAQDLDTPVTSAIDVNAVTTEVEDRPQLRATWAYAAGVLNVAEVRELADLWVQALTALTTYAARPDAGGLTPSDLDLVTMNQDAIDRIESRFPALAEIWSLSPLQSGLLFHALLADQSIDSYTVQMTLELSGAVASRLRTAGQALLDRHANLRASFVYDEDGTPVQAIHRYVELPWTETDLSELDEVSCEAEIARLVDADRVRGFDMAEPPLLRFMLVHVGDDRQKLIVTNHHILLDGWSMPLLIRDLLTLYVTEGDVAALPRVHPYRDYLAWMSHRSTENSLEVWQRALAGVAEPTLLAPADASVQSDTQSSELVVDLDADRTDMLSVLARERGLTLSTLIRTAWGIVLGGLVGRSDVVFGGTVSGRPPQIAGIESMVGLFINTLPVRVVLYPGESLGELLERVQGEQAALLDHHYVGLTDIQSVAGAGAGFDTLTVFESYPVDKEGLTEQTDIAGMHVLDVHDSANAAHYPLALIASAHEHLQLKFEYLPDLFDRASIERIGDRLVRALIALAETPDMRLAQLRLLTDAEETELVPVRGRPGSSKRTLPQMFSATAAIAGDSTALVFGDRRMSYRELDERSSQLARILIDHGVGPEDIVALGITRSIESVLAVWSITKTGAAFVPVDPNYPRERVEHMLTDSGATLGVQVGTDRDRLPGAVTWLTLDDAEIESATKEMSSAPITDDERIVPLRFAHPAYVIYTSGSTGTPKGVVVSHRGLDNFAEEQRARYGTDSSSRTMHFSSPSFDASVLDYLLPFAVGATMVIVPPSVYGGEELADLIRSEGVTHGFITPAALASVDPEGLEVFQNVVAGGEAVPPELVARWAPGRRLFNGYGPTETTIMANISDPLDVGETVTIGAPVRGVAEVILDARLQPVPLGVAGELYITGEGLARGYHARAALTSERFVANPFGEPGDRMYRTGDLARWRPDHTVEYLGRTDFQVKIRGFRIELGDIDSALSGHPSVSFAVTLGRPGPAGDTVLVSYVLPEPDSILEPPELKQWTAGLLPAHMVPSSIMLLDEIPLTPVGKLDRTALPAPQFLPTSDDFRAPSTVLEHTIADVFTTVLGIERVGIDDNFFDIGGNSLVATRVAARLTRELDTDIGVRVLFEAPTIHLLARLIESTEFAPAHDGDHVRVPLVPMPRTEHIPVSLAQKRMWFLNQFDTSSAAYNIPLAVRLAGHLDVESLREAVTDVFVRHESLRTVFPSHDGEPTQVVLSPGQWAPNLEITEASEDELREHIAGLATAGFDVTAEVPMRSALFALAPDDHVLVIVVHHICADGFSLAPLARDVMAAYAARIAGGAPQWHPLSVQYADYTLWQLDQLGSESDAESLISRQLQFWTDQLADLPELLQLPIDHARPIQQSFHGAQVDFTVPADVHRSLSALARKHNSTVFMAVHAALSVLLSALSSTEDIAVGTPIAGRGDAALDDMVGMFVNTLVLRASVDPAEGFGALIDQVRATDLAAFHHSDLPFERLVDVLAPERSTAHSPLFQVMLEFRNNETPTLELPELTASAVDFDLEVAKFDLQLGVEEIFGADGVASGITASFIFASDLFDAGTVRTFADRFLCVLDAVTSDPQAPVGDIVLTDAAERLVMATEWNVAGVDSGGDTLADRFAQSVARFPDATAVTSEDVALTYTELDERSNRLARFLISRGVGPECLVAVALPRNCDLIIALLGVIKTGAGYLPVDITNPSDRLAFVFEDAAPNCVLTTTGDVSALPGSEMPPILLDDPETTGNLAQQSPEPITDADRVAPLDPSSVAYVIYTSGSTGRPKGVVVSHRNVLTLFENTQPIYGFDETDVWTMFHSYAFDFSVWELWGPLLYGGRLVVVDYYTARSPEMFHELLRNEQVTVLNQTPTAFYQLAETDRIVSEMDVNAAALALRYVIFGGEALDLAQLGRWYSRHDAAAPTLVNMYGITETTVHVSYLALDPEFAASTSASVIGRGIAGLHVHVLDRRLRPVPPGTIGEMYVSGDQVTRGYLGRAALSSTRFVADPVRAGARMYRTGDLARWNKSGQLEYLGRSDFQVKIRGFRIELGEIEAALLRYRGIAQAVVLTRDDGHGGHRLIGYVVPESGATVEVSSALEFVGTQLTAYMVPATLVVLDALPLTSNGKLDSRALPEPDFGARVSSGRAPATEMETVLAGLFAEVLGLETVGV